MIEFDATEDVLASLGYRLRPIPRKRATFLKGPLPLAWLMRIDVAAHTAVLALVIKALVDAMGSEPVVVPAIVWDQWRLTRYQRKLALDALERTGVIRTERTPGKATRIWLIDKP